MGILKKWEKNPERIWLVVSTYPSEKWWISSVGMMKFPTEWKNKNNIKHVPNHQPVIDGLMTAHSNVDGRTSTLTPKIQVNCIIFPTTEIARNWGHPPILGKAEIASFLCLWPWFFLEGMTRSYKDIPIHGKKSTPLTYSSPKFDHKLR